VEDVFEVKRQEGASEVLGDVCGCDWAAISGNFVNMVGTEIWRASPGCFDFPFSWSTLFDRACTAAGLVLR